MFVTTIDNQQGKNMKSRSEVGKFRAAKVKLKTFSLQYNVSFYAPSRQQSEIGMRDYNKIYTCNGFLKFLHSCNLKKPEM